MYHLYLCIYDICIIYIKYHKIHFKKNTLQWHAEWYKSILFNSALLNYYIAFNIQDIEFNKCRTLHFLKMYLYNVFLNTHFLHEFIFRIIKYINVFVYAFGYFQPS